MVEYTLGVGRAATTAPAMKKAGEGVAATFQKLGETLGKGGQAQVQSGEGLPVDTQWLRGPLRMGPFADPVTITAGLTLNELLNRYGDPVMKTPGGVGTDAGETYWYRTPAGYILAEVREGKVAVVNTEAERKQRATAGLVIVQ
jgi:hypothetical protein